MKKPASKDLLFVGTQILLFVVYLIPITPYPLYVPDLLKNISLVVAILGLGVIGLAVVQLNDNLTPFPTPKEKGVLIQTGLYKYIRHPIYSGIILFTVGWGVFDENIWKIGIGTLLWTLFYFKSSYEETLLMNKFEAYKTYRKTTGRFFCFFK